MSESSFISLDTSYQPQMSETGSILLKIDDELQNLTSFELVKGALLFKIDGQLIQSSFRDTNLNSLINVVSWIKNIIFKVSLELRNQLYRIAYSRENEHIYFYKVGSSAILACILDKFANVGLLSIEMDRIAYKISEIVHKMS